MNQSIGGNSSRDGWISKRSVHHPVKFPAPTWIFNFQFDRFLGFHVPTTFSCSHEAIPQTEFSSLNTTKPNTEKVHPWLLYILIIRKEPNFHAVRNAFNNGVYGNGALDFGYCWNVWRCRSLHKIVQESFSFDPKQQSYNLAIRNHNHIIEYSSEQQRWLYTENWNIGRSVTSIQGTILIFTLCSVPFNRFHLTNYASFIFVFNRDPGVYDWYQTYENLRHLLTPEILKRPFNGITRLQDIDRPTKDPQITLDTISNEFPSRDNCRVLILGCGNSAFGDDMKEDGWTGDIVNVDLSSVVINQMIRKQENKYGAEDAHSRMEFVCADITHGLPFADSSFDLIICKGTFDAILCSNGSVSSIKRLVAECDRVLAPAHGCLFVVTHGTPDNRVVFFEHANDPTYYWEGICIDTVAKRDQASSQ